MIAACSTATNSPRLTSIDHGTVIIRAGGDRRRIASAGGRRRAGVSGALGGRRRPARRRARRTCARSCPTDADRLRRFYDRLSDETIYYRFFSLYRELSDRDVERYTVVDHDDRVALVATVGERDDRRRPLRAHHARRGGGRVQHRGRAPGPRSRLGVPRAHRRGRPGARHLAFRRRRAARQPEDAAGLLRRRLRREPARSTTESSGCPSASSPPRTRAPSPTPASTAPRPVGRRCCTPGVGGGRRRRPDRASVGPRRAAHTCRRGLHRSGPRGQQPADEVAGAPVVPERRRRAGSRRPGGRRGAGRRGRGGRRRLRRQGRARAGRDGDRLRRDRPRGRGAPAPAGRAGPGERHAGGRPELLRRHRHRPRGLAERLPLPAGPAARGRASSPSPARSGSPCSTTPYAGGSACRRSSRRATGSTSAATT